MSFPTVIFGAEHTVYATTAARRYPFGTLLVTQDGRKFRYAENAGTAIAAGRLAQSAIPGANFDELVSAAAAVGAKVITVTTGATAISADDFFMGYLNVEDDTGEGHLYHLDSHLAIATTTAGDMNLFPPGVRVATVAATTVGLTKHYLKDIVIHDSVPTAMLAGVPPSTLAADNFGWVQRGGPASVLTDGTVVIGFSVMASNGTDGAVEAWGLAEAAPPTEIGPLCGWVMEVAATTEHSLIYLKLE